MTKLIAKIFDVDFISESTKASTRAIRAMFGISSQLELDVIQFQLGYSRTNQPGEAKQVVIHALTRELRLGGEQYNTLFILQVEKVPGEDNWRVTEPSQTPVRVILNADKYPYVAKRIPQTEIERIAVNALGKIERLIAGDSKCANISSAHVWELFLRDGHAGEFTFYFGPQRWIDIRFWLDNDGSLTPNRAEYHTREHSSFFRFNPENDTWSEILPTNVNDIIWLAQLTWFPRAIESRTLPKNLRFGTNAARYTWLATEGHFDQGLLPQIAEYFGDKWNQEVEN